MPQIFNALNLSTDIVWKKQKGTGKRFIMNDRKPLGRYYSKGQYGSWRDSLFLKQSGNGYNYNTNPRFNKYNIGQNNLTNRQIYQI
jgi:hypothetical protein